MRGESARPASPTGASKRGRGLLWFVVVAILGLLGLLGFAMLPDDPSSSAYPDLEPPAAVTIEPERNLYVALQECARLYSEREPKTEPVANWLERNVKTIEALRAASALTEYAPPAESEIDAERYSVASRVFDLSSLGFAHITRLRERGDLDRAFEDSMAFLALGHRARAGARLHADWVAMMSMSQTATQPLLEMAQAGLLSSRQLQSLLAALDARSPWLEDTDRMLRCECAFAAELIRRAASSGDIEDLVPPGSPFASIPLSLVVKPNRTIDELAARVREVRHELRHPSRESASRQEPTSRLEMVTAALRGNFLGEQVARGYALYVSSLIELGRVQERQLIVLEVATALALRKVDGKAAPTTLEELCAGIIDPLPTDPYTLETVQLDPERTMVRVGKSWHSLLTTESEPVESPR